MPRMREVALEQKVNKLNAVVSAQADRIEALESLVRDMWLHSYCSIAKTRDEYIAQLEAELAHQKPQDAAQGAIEYEDERTRRVGEV